MATRPTTRLEAPFPWFGGKRRVAHLVWERFGEVRNYVEPFCGSCAVLLGRPDFDAATPPVETANDLDGFVCNAWRAIHFRPDETAEWADWPVNENDLHARHVWLRERREDLARRLEADPNFCDPKIAGWWVWGVSCWIGGSFCGDKAAGPWRVVVDEDGGRRLLRGEPDGTGVRRKLPHMGNGKGVMRRLSGVESDADGVTRKKPNVVAHGVHKQAPSHEGVTRKLPHLSRGGHGVHQEFPSHGRSSGVQRRRVQSKARAVTRDVSIRDWFRALSERLRRVWVACGDWRRVCGPSVTFKKGLTGVFLDPPYSTGAGRDMEIYAKESGDVAAEAREWALANADNPLMRIALCGYEGEHAMPGDWECVAWRAHGGYASISKGKGNGRCNAKRERIWFSPACLNPARQTRLFEEVEA